LIKPIVLANKIGYKKGLANAYNGKGRAVSQQGDLVEAHSGLSGSFDLFP